MTISRFDMDAIRTNWQKHAISRFNALRGLSHDLDALGLQIRYVVGRSVRVFASDVLTTRHRMFGPESYENKGFPATLPVRSNMIALWWVCTGKSGQPCNTRGRQQQWYKELWLLQWRRLWRLLPHRATRQQGNPLTRLFKKSPANSGAVNGKTCRGWTALSVRGTFVSCGGI